MLLAKVATSLDIKPIQETKRKVNLKMAMVFGIIPTVLLILAHFQG